jgi:hypothetical protein
MCAIRRVAQADQVLGRGHGTGDLIHAGTHRRPRQVTFDNNDGKGTCSLAGDIHSSVVPRHDDQPFDAEARKILHSGGERGFRDVVELDAGHRVAGFPGCRRDSLVSASRSVEGP